MVVDEVDELGAGESLAAFGELRRIRDRASRDIFILAAHFADLYNVEATRGELRTVAGTERGVKVAGDGAPLVLEFAIAEMAVELAMTTWSARRLIGDALETRHRLPRLWGRVQAGEVPAWVAGKVAQATRPLTREQAATVDEELVEYADGRLSYRRFSELLEAKIIAADPDAAAARERAAAEQRFAKVGQSNDHGQKTLYVKTSAAEMIRIDTTIAYLAEGLKVLGDSDDEDCRRTKAVLIMANPDRALALLQAIATHNARSQAASGAGSPDYADEDSPLPDDDADEPEECADGGDDGAADTADPGRPGGAPGSAGDDPPVPHAEPPAAAAFTKPFRPGDVPACSCRGGTFIYDSTKLLPEVLLYLHLHADTLRAGNGVARWEGEGPISALYVRDFLGPHCRFIVKPVIDPARMPAVDGYEVPDDLREALHLRTPADVFPFAGNTGRKKQADHTKSYVPPDRGGPPGQTGLENLGGMVGFHHRVKTHAGWQLKQPFPGIYLWRAPHGSIFLVDHTGTRQLRGPRTSTPTTSARPTDATESSRETRAHPTGRTRAKRLLRDACSLRSPLEERLRELVSVP